MTSFTDALTDALDELQLRCVLLPVDESSRPWTRTFPENAVSLHLVLEGLCLIQTDLPVSRHHLREGELLIVNGAGRGALRAASEAPPPEVVSARIDLHAPLGHPMLAAFPRLIRVSAGLVPRSFETCVDGLREEMTLRKLGRGWIVARLCETLFVQALRRHIDDLGWRDRGWFRMLADPLLRDPLLEASKPEARVSSLAAALGRSRQRTRMRFTQLGGTSPSVLLRRARIRRAVGLLTAGEADLVRVARESGFGSRQALCRAFRHEMGTTPAAHWRAVHRCPFPRPARGVELPATDAPTTSPEAGSDTAGGSG